jgi:two-component system phosphate regulon sensor histidine kinase PhoR
LKTNFSVFLGPRIFLFLFGLLVAFLLHEIHYEQQLKTLRTNIQKYELSENQQTELLNNIKKPFRQEKKLFDIAILLISLVFFLFYYHLQYLHQISTEKMEKALQFISERKPIPKDMLNDKAMGQLVTHVNITIEKLQELHSKIERRKEGFFLLLESLQEILWIQNNRGLITACNKSFEKLMQKEHVSDSYFWNVLPNGQLLDFANQLFKQPKNEISQLDFAGKTFFANASYHAASQEVIFILHDVTEYNNLTTLKRDFALNVSHELRTPLTSIKGFIETMAQELDSEHLPYLQVLQRNTDRLIAIVEDLLTLSRLEHGEKIEYETVNLTQLLQNIKKMMEQKLKEKNLELMIDTEAGLFIEADAYKLEQVFINLLDNAIKYSDKGQIQIQTKIKNNDCQIAIKDSGIGIPAEHIPRIFDRFYVVNKSRARKYSSSGLGLSIVKHIIQLHGGSVDVYSKVNEGTTFTITLPVKR